MLQTDLVMKYLTLIVLLMFSCLQACQPVLPDGDPDNGGLYLPDGFEAVVVIDSTGRARHLAVDDEGDIYVKLRMPDPEGENVAIRDTDGDGKADIVKKWADLEDAGRYGCGMRLYNGYLYYSTAGTVYRSKLEPGELVPGGKPEIILTDDYRNAKWRGAGAHIAKPLAFDNKGHLYVPFGAPSDVCREISRQPGSMGKDPCPELERHAGVWKFDANKRNQNQDDGVRYATGIRSIVGWAWNNKEDALYALQHGRDNFVNTWPDKYNAWQSAMLPSEEFLRVDEGINAGWPYYYYDQLKGKRILNPEYGGDGEIEADGADYTQPIYGFPGHWAPNDLLFYEGDQFPERYRNGAFIAFHGSTIRAPYPQAGYFIAFMPFKDGLPSGPWEVFADGFVKDTLVNTSDAVYRPMGLAEGPDGSLYITESEKGKIWRVMFKGDRDDFGEEHLMAMEERNSKPHIKQPDPVEDNLDRFRLSEGEKLYNLYCGACHQRDGKGDGNRFPPLNESEWVNGDPNRLIEIVLFGMDGPITVKGLPYSGMMPANQHLGDEVVAQILTYVRENFNNDGGAIREREVRRVRHQSEREQRMQEDI